MKKIMMKIWFFVFVLFLGITGVQATSFSVGVSSKSITKGGSATLTIKGSDVTGRFNISTSNASVVSISEDRAWIENDSYSIKLTALNVGTATITITPSGVSDSNGAATSLAPKTVQITVSLPREKSSDNNLKSLIVEGYELSPAFDKNIQTYNTVVPEGTKSVVISAVKNEDHASVKGTGEMEVSSGSNSFNVIVTSETGVEKTYTVNVEVKDSNPIVVSVGGASLTVVKLKEDMPEVPHYQEHTVQMNGFDIPAYKSDNTGFVLVGLKDTEGKVALYIYDDDKNEYKIYQELGVNKVSLYPIETTEEIDGYTKGKVEINGVTVDGYYYDESSRFVIVYGVNVETGEKGFYMYDKESQAFIKYNDEYTLELKEKIDLYSKIIIGFSGIFVLFLLILIFRKPRKKKKKQEKDKNGVSAIV
ncbi:MAG: cadherin-like beta sandwich domain-containing protein, partial [Bacilli bacterium]|nr:cadherin-like beta sandwich domain-containing protein [Bacilli bacterium]